ncbi:hypothetical protein NCU10396 [Neurospora crassa OR74A]|uniref:Uncharacterized protein n=1 Tax=Neurospora crassa (strain ATCC 24698 / 74-OR23-1A / CBS 708.71 / DSM 1257 / FGSC 987) TaxID=367110 RepID=A7UWH3_NEUCR|nr:hypothetical protein NCU10396 [Neurospora crassa OR74A]EDO65184.2 hypothetical protein NCU10396 [Neurospora crassa OR74A]|eukprot:XP_001728275.2 hypothetical protein NCU10396 [Neurospora crassa OR74A]
MINYGSIYDGLKTTPPCAGCRADGKNKRSRRTRGGKQAGSPVGHSSPVRLMIDDDVDDDDDDDDDANADDEVFISKRRVDEVRTGAMVPMNPDPPTPLVPIRNPPC